MSDNSLGALAACAIWVAMASSGSDLTKSPFQYHCRPLGSSGSNSACKAGNGITPIQLKIGGGKLSNNGAMALRPSCSVPLKQEVMAQARLPQYSRGKGSVEGDGLQADKGAEIFRRLRQVVAIDTH